MTNSSSRGEIYVICSDDPLLKLDKSQEIIQRWRKEVPDAEFLLYTFSELQGNNSNYKFQDIETELSDPGLFGGERIIKVVLKDMDNLAIELFKLIAGNMRDGLYILIEMPRITSKLAKSKEVDAQVLHRFLSFTGDSEGAKALAAQEKGTKKKASAKGKTSRKGEAAKSEAIGYLRDVGAQFLILYPPEGNELKGWITERAARYGFRVAADALDFIARSCDNNLLSIDHSLQVLEMMQDNTQGKMTTLTMDMVEDYFTQDARYSGFELPQAIFTGDPLKALSIISSFCSGLETNFASALGLLISRMDSSLNAICEGKLQNIARSDMRARQAFFLSRNIKVPSSQDVHMRAMQRLSDAQLQIMSACLSEASAAYSSFEYDAAYRALQRLALATSSPEKLPYLSADLLRT